MWINPASLASRSRWDAGLLLPDDIILKHLKRVTVIRGHWDYNSAPQVGDQDQALDLKMDPSAGSRAVAGKATS